MDRRHHRPAGGHHHPPAPPVHHHHPAPPVHHHHPPPPPVVHHHPPHHHHHPTPVIVFPSPPAPVVVVDHHHHSPPPVDIFSRPSVKMYCKADTTYSLSISHGKVILVRSNPSDPLQHWIKDDKYSTTVRDQEGLPSFALVNKATGQALKHSIGANHPVQLVQYNPNALDESILWTEKDLGDGFKAVRMVNNIRLNVDALHGERHHGGVHDGSTVVLGEWKKGENQRWRIDFHYDVVSGFIMLIESAEDMALNIPIVVEDLAMFLARVEVDEVLTPQEMDEIGRHFPGPASVGNKVTQMAMTLLRARLSGERILRCWEGRGSGGSCNNGRTVEDVKDKVGKLLEEYAAGGDTREACRCIKELGMPFFHHEVVKKCLVILMESKNERMSGLLKHCFDMQLITMNQMSKGFVRVFESLDDLPLDMPDAKK